MMHYSGGEARRFWARIDALARQRRDEVYWLGLQLQDLEILTVRALEKAEQP